MGKQKELIFFTGDPPSEDARREYCNPDNPKSPFSKFIGNRKAINRLSRAAFVALGRYNHVANDQNFAFIGPASTGKTTLVKLYVEKTLQLPFVQLNSETIKKGHDIFREIANTCRDTKVGDLSLTLYDYGNQNFILPPMAVFIDEVHNLSKKVVQLLLPACEAKDHTLTTEFGCTVDCKNVCWCIATTDRGDLFDAFDTRFTKISLELYSKKELAQIIHLDHPDLDIKVCELIAKYNSIPREALAFAQDMKLFHQFDKSKSWEEVAKETAEDHGIDPYGMTYRRLKILRVLQNQGSVSRTNLATIAGCKVEELIKFTLPPLIYEQMISVSSKGYAITDAGRNALTMRGIK